MAEVGWPRNTQAQAVLALVVDVGHEGRGPVGCLWAGGTWRCSLDDRTTGRMIWLRGGEAVGARGVFGEEDALELVDAIGRSALVGNGGGLVGDKGGSCC